ncbi:MAG: TolC family protein [Cytophagales bacterium]
MKYLQAVHLLLLVAFNSIAQDSSTVFTLQQCIDRSLKNNIQLKQNELNVESAEISRKLANEARYPSLSANITPGLNFGRTVDFSTNQFRDQNYSQSSFSINSNLILFSGFRLSNIIKQNKYSAQAIEFELKDFKNTLILNVLNAYVQILYNKEALKNAQNQLLVTNSQTLRTEKLVNGGISPISNLLDLKSKAANDESAMINAENQLNIAKLNLIQFMNLPLEKYEIEKIEIEIPAFIDTTNMEETPKEIYKLAEQTQPSVKGADLRLKSSQFAYFAAKGNMYPRLTLISQINSYYSSLTTRVTGYQFGEPVFNGSIVNNDPTLRVFQPTFRALTENSPLYAQLSDNLAPSFSLNLFIPIYTNRTARASAENADISRKNAELNLQNAKQQLRKKIEQAFLDAKGAQKKFDAALTQVLANEEAFRVTEKRFNAGVINAVDYTIASNALNLARSNQIQSKYDLILKKKIVEFYKYNDIQL